MTAKITEPSFKTLLVWKKFTEFYGAAWINEFGERPNQSWTEEIEKLTPTEIARGLEQCKRSGNPFAPRLPQFLAFCVGNSEQRAFYARTQGENKNQLPKPPPNPEIKRAALAEIKSTLGMPETKKPEL